MRITDLLFHKTGRAPAAVKAPAAERIGVQKPLPPLSRDLQNTLRLLSHSAIASACIRIKMKAMTDPTLRVYKRDGDGMVEQTGHPLRRVLLRPMPTLDEAGFIGAAIASMDIAGVFFAEKIRSNAGAIVGLNPINPVYMTPRKDVNGTHTGYTYARGTYRADFTFDDLLVRDARDWFFTPPLATAAESIELDELQTDFARAFFQNGGQPSGILKKSGILRDQAEAQSIQARWQAKYGRGGNGWGAPAVLDDTMSYERIGSMLNELDNETLRMFAETRICMAFGVPPLIVYTYAGIVKSTYSNLKEAWASFWDAELSPTLKEWRSFFTWSLLPEFAGEEAVFNEQYTLEWDLSKVAALQEDVDAAQARMRANFQAGLATLNEARHVAGLPRDDAGDYYLRGLAVQPVPKDAALLDLLPAAPEPATRSAVPGRVTAYKAASTARVQQQIERAARQYLLNEYEQAAQAVLEAAG